MSIAGDVADVSTRPYWVTAFLDFAPEEHEAGVALWSRLTGWPATPPRGPDGEYSTLLPPDGDDYLGLQRLGSGPSRIHLDVHVADARAAALQAVDLGASLMADHDDFLTLASPGGFVFCLVSHPSARRPQPPSWPDGLRSYVDQVCLDIPPSAYDAEFDFWHALTGWERKDPRPGSEFGRLNPPGDQPLQLLLQRLDDEEDAVRAHLDWAATDREQETARHVEAGAELVERFEAWTVLRGPTGMTYCITRRSPETGVPG